MCSRARGLALVVFFGVGLLRPVAAMRHNFGAIEDEALRESERLELEADEALADATALAAGAEAAAKAAAEDNASEELAEVALDAEARAEFAAAYAIDRAQRAGRPSSARSATGSLLLPSLGQRGIFQPKCITDKKIASVAGRKDFVHSGRTHLLFITLSYKANPKEYLPGTFTDTRNLMNYMKKHGEFDKPTSCVVLSDAPVCVGLKPICTTLRKTCSLKSRAVVTGRDIEAALAAFVKRLKKGDKGILQYCGHSVRINWEANPNEINGKSEALAGTNSGATRYVRDEWLYANLVAKVPRGAYVFSIFDSCHSADILNLPWHWDNVKQQWCWMWDSPVNKPWKSQLKITQTRKMAAGFSTMLAGTQVDEEAADLGELRGGAFSAELFRFRFWHTSRLDAKESLRVKMSKLDQGTPEEQHPNVCVLHPFTPDRDFRPLRGPFSSNLKAIGAHTSIRQRRKKLARATQEAVLTQNPAALVKKRRYIKKMPAASTAPPESSPKGKRRLFR